MSEKTADYRTKGCTVLGVDPGIANTGLAVVHRKNRTDSFILIESVHVVTPSDLSRPERLEKIDAAVWDSLVRLGPSLVVIENVFHNKNVSSSVSTACVIGIVELCAAKFGVPVEIVTPQRVKKAVGAQSHADKKEVNHLIGLMLGGTFKSHHLADAAAAAIAGILQLESEVVK